MIPQNVRNIQETINEVCKKLGRNPDEITLIAVSKTFGSESIRNAMAAGLVDFGENYVQELITKQKELEQEHIRWHFIGHLQRNKVKYILPWIHTIQSVDSLRLGEEISRQAEKYGKTLEVLVEVNSSAEDSKFGVAPESALALVKDLQRFPNLTVTGLMTIGKFGDHPEESRPCFRILRELKEEGRRAGIALPHLSMGMTHDFTVALEEGATILRIGTAIFGKRNYQE